MQQARSLTLFPLGCFGIIAFSLAVFGQPKVAAAQITLQESGPVVASSDGQIIENLIITAIGSHGIEVVGYSNVTIRNVEIFHEGGHGILCLNAPGIMIENVSIEHTGVPQEPKNRKKPAKASTATGGYNNVNCEGSDGITVSNTRVTGGAAGFYILDSDGPHLTMIEAYNMRGPFPRGQAVQFNKSPDCFLQDFYSWNDPDPAVSWPEDNVNIYGSPRCIIRRGLVDGNNSPSGVGVLFEDGGSNSNDGRVEDVDAIRMGNGPFTSWGPDRVMFIRSRWRDNICTDQGRGEPLSGGQGWVFASDAHQGVVYAGGWYNRCFSRYWISSTSDATIEILENDFTLREAIHAYLPWESEGPPPNNLPTASFANSATGLSVAFTDTSMDSDGTVTSWSWNFGDGNSATQQDPTHAYASDGTYNVTLTVTDDEGGIDNTTQQVTAGNQAPTAGFTYSATDLSIILTDTSTDGDGTISSWSWNFGDGNSSTQQHPSHTYQANGNYTVTLTVTDGSGAANDTDATSRNVSVDDGVNDPSTLALANATTSMPEDTDTASAIKVADIVITDDGTGTNVLSLSGSDAGDFVLANATLNGADLMLKTGTVLPAAGGSLTVRVNVDDSSIGGTPDDFADLTINVTDVVVPSMVHLGDLQPQPINQGKNWTATVTATVHDNNHVDVSNATVNVSWTGGSGSCTTNGSGSCNVTGPQQRKSNRSVTMTVDGITHATLTYDDAINDVLTTIIVLKP